MRQLLEIPIILRRIRIDGLQGSREIDMILDTGAMYTAISWDTAKDIGYDPAVATDRVHNYNGQWGNRISKDKNSRNWLWGIIC
jgi:hypothetical protein